MDLIERIKILRNHLGAKNFKKVIEGSTKLLKKFPNNFYILNLVGMAYQGSSNHEYSIQYFREALKYDPNNIAIMNNYANSLKGLGKLEASEELYEKILKINSNYVNAYNNYANLKTLINDYEGAIKLYEKAVEILKKTPNIPATSRVGILFSLASAYQSNNKIEDTKKTIDEVFSIDPSHSAAHKLLSSILKYKREDKKTLDHIDKMEDLYNRDNHTNLEKKIDLSFALGKAYEDLKDFKKSYEYLSTANKIKFEKFGSNLEEERKAISNIIKNFKNINLNAPNQNPENKKIIFIVGMPRSGTTLTEQIIASHNEVYGAGELIYLQQVLKKNFINDSKYNFQKILENQNSKKNIIFSEYLEYFKLYDLKESVVTDKAPQNFRYIGFIKLFFPNCKIIHCYRNPKDNCLSLYKNSFASNTMHWTNKGEDIAEFYNLYSQMMKFWKSKIPDFIYDVEYEKLVKDKESEIKKILKFCNLDWDEKCLNPDKHSKTPIKTVSVSQARQPIYQSSLNSNSNYDKFLDKMFKILDQ